MFAAYIPRGLTSPFDNHNEKNPPSEFGGGNFFDLLYLTSNRLCREHSIRLS